MEITSPYGPVPAGSWRCERCTRESGLIIREAGDGGTGIRDAAKEHARLTGHTVTVLIGLEETLTALRTEVA